MRWQYNQPLMEEHGYWAVTESDITHATTDWPSANSNKEELTVYPLFSKSATVDTGR